MKTGLILEGGAMRGLYSCGIMDVMMEQGIEFDGIVGVSAGACFGCNYLSRQPGRAVRYNARFAKDPRYCSFRSLIKTGDLYGAEFCYRTVPEQLDVFDVETFRASKTAFYVVVTDAETGRPVYRQLKNADRTDLEWMRASASMPLVSHPVELEGRKYLDGGVSDSIPLAFFENMGYHRNIVILTRPRDYVKEPQKGLFLFGKYPGIRKAMARRHEMYNRQAELVRSREAEGRALVFAPEQPLPISRVSHDPEEMRAVYEIGRRAAEARMDEIKRFLRENEE